MSADNDGKHDGSRPFDYMSASIDEIRERCKGIEQRLVTRGAGTKPAAGQLTNEDDAARVLQSSYANYRSRREMTGHNLTASDRFTEGLRQRQISKSGKEQNEGVNDAASRWKRSEVYANKISEGSRGKNSDKPVDMTVEEEMNKLARNEKERKRIAQERNATKQLESQYYLEIVDAKHRYASNLKYYHREWNNRDTKQNFFTWLDEGEGKELDLEECPRSRLDRERVTFLNAEQRRNYKVYADDAGLLRWEKNDEPVDTSKYHRDDGPNVGIVPISEEEQAEIEARQKERRKKIRDNGGNIPSSSSSSSSSDEAEEIIEGVQPYSDKGGTAGQGKGFSQMKARVRYYTSPKAVMDRALRETINKNTWIFAADLKGNLYIGIKKTGTFQHSSFLSGARVTAAGLIKVNEGKLTSLSPLSGHYRAGTMHFKAFLRKLEEQHVDMSSVAISKSVLTIRGIEKYGSAMKKKDKLFKRVKKAVTGGASSEEEKREKEKRDREVVKQKHKEHGDEPQDLKHGSQRASDLKLAELSLDRPLPADGKQIEDMTEDERMDRGVALMQRAFERGLLLGRGDDDGEKDQA